MWNSRVTSTVVASVIVMLILCALLGAAYAPYYADRRDQRLTQIADGFNTATAAVTQAAGATRLAQRPTLTAIAGATQTEAARPTITPTPTDTPTPTATPTATPPAAVVECSATVTGAVTENGVERRLYPVPGGGQVRNAAQMPRGGAVTVIGRLEDAGWLQVRSEAGDIGWMRSDTLELEPPGCRTNIYALSYLLGLVEGQVVITDDTLISNENGWVNGAAEPVSPVLNAYGDAQLHLNTNTQDRLRPSNPRLSDLPAFQLVTSLSRVNLLSDSYVGVRFRDNGLTYYEVRVQRNCQVGVYAVTEQVFTRPVAPGDNTCTDEQEDWLHLVFTADNLLTVQLNDADPFEVHLDDSAGLYTGGGLALVVNHARASFSFIVITAPR
ncbi:MAG: SH3 domain-containing protein [Anaerolineales bacterium]|nr:SH3 domain-containing protein [Anaerolineales bacterium]